MIPHIYVNASDDPGAYAADQCGLQAVTVAFAYEHLCNRPLWMFNAEAKSYGLDPWIIVQGCDRSISGKEYYVEHGATGSKTMPPDGRIYVQVAVLNTLGLIK
jgi:hypothetical protein